MGYTHHWEAATIPQPLWDEFIGKIGIVIANHQNILAVDEISTDALRFNGIGDGAYEDFCLYRKAKGFGGFCKTSFNTNSSERPYDKIIVAALALLREITKEDDCEFSWSSDGGDSYHDEGLALVGLAESNAVD